MQDIYKQIHNRKAKVKLNAARNGFDVIQDGKIVGSYANYCAALARADDVNERGNAE